jgi:hypothetical protein
MIELRRRNISDNAAQGSKPQAEIAVLVVPHDIVGAKSPNGVEGLAADKKRSTRNARYLVGP